MRFDFHSSAMELVSTAADIYAEYLSIGRNAARYGYLYVFTTSPFSYVKEDAFVALDQFFMSLKGFLLSLINVTYYIVLILLKLIMLALPHAMKSMKSIYKFHATQLSTKELFVEAAVISITLLAFLFRKSIAEKWNQFVRYIEKKSKRAAQLAPHVFFFSVSFLLSYFGKKFIAPFTSGRVMPLFTLGIPVTTCFIAWNSTRRSSADTESLDLIRANNLLWIAFALYHGIATLLSCIPFASHLSRELPVLKEFALVISIWIQLSPHFTSVVLDTLIMPAMRKFSVFSPTNNIEEVVNSKSVTLFSVLKAIHVLTTSQELFLRNVLQDGISTLIVVAFMFVPYPFSRMGEVIITWVVPASRVSALLLSRSNSGNKSVNLNSRSLNLSPTAAASVISSSSQEKVMLSTVLSPPFAQSSDESSKQSLIAKTIANVFSPSSKIQTVAISTPRPLHLNEEQGCNPAAISSDVFLVTELKKWTQYWICCGILWFLRIYGLNIWAPFHMVLVLWLQHSYFQGASVVLSFAADFLSVAARRNAEAQAERLSARVKERVQERENRDSSSIADCCEQTSGSSSDHNSSSSSSSTSKQHVCIATDTGLLTENGGGVDIKDEIVHNIDEEHSEFQLTAKVESPLRQRHKRK